MIIAFRTRYCFDQVLAIGQWVVVCAAVALLGYFSVRLIQVQEIVAVTQTANGESTRDLSKVLAGPFGLCENQRSPLAIALEQKLVFLAQSMRPDMKDAKKTFCVGVKGSGEQRIVKEGEEIFFEMTQHDTGAIESFFFLEEKAEHSMVAHMIDGESLLLKLGDADCFLQASSEGKTIGKIDASIESLYKAKWLGEDAFLRQYGGKEYKILGQKQKLELIKGANHQILFVNEGDLLSFVKGKWEVLSSIEEADAAAPLACVRSVQNQQMEIEAWDGEGFPLFYAKLTPKEKRLLQPAACQIVQEPKLRSAKQISCKIGKKRMLLSPGDWLFKAQTGWRKLITVDEIDAYLNHKLNGELLVLDTIDSKGKLKGFYFDQTRTQKLPFSVRAASSKGKQTQKRTTATKS